MNRRSRVVGRGSWIAILVLTASLGGLALHAQQPGRPTMPMRPDMGPTMKPVATVRQLHDAMIIPASNALFALEKKAPKDKTGWAAAKTHALLVAEAGNLLMIGTRARDRGQWLKFARSLVDKAEAEMNVLDKQSSNDVLIANGDMLEVCEGCHTVYRDKGKGMPR